MTEIRTIRLPYRDVERRKLLGLMLGLPRSVYWSKFTCEEMQEIALKRGLLKNVNDERVEERETTGRTIQDLPKLLSNKLNMVHDLLIRADFQDDADKEAADILVSLIEKRLKR